MAGLLTATSATLSGEPFLRFFLYHAVLNVSQIVGFQGEHTYAKGPMKLNNCAKHLLMS